MELVVAQQRLAQQKLGANHRGRRSTITDVALTVGKTGVGAVVGTGSALTTVGMTGVNVVVGTGTAALNVGAKAVVGTGTAALNAGKTGVNAVVAGTALQTVGKTGVSAVQTVGKTGVSAVQSVGTVALNVGKTGASMAGMTARMLGVPIPRASSTAEMCILEEEEDNEEELILQAAAEFSKDSSAEESNPDATETSDSSNSQEDKASSSGKQEGESSETKQKDDKTNIDSRLASVLHERQESRMLLSSNSSSHEPKAKLHSRKSSGSASPKPGSRKARKDRSPSGSGSKPKQHRVRRSSLDPVQRVSSGSGKPKLRRTTTADETPVTERKSTGRKASKPTKITRAKSTDGSVPVKRDPSTGSASRAKSFSPHANHWAKQALRELQEDEDEKEGEEELLEFLDPQHQRKSEGCLDVLEDSSDEDDQKLHKRSNSDCMIMPRSSGHCKRESKRRAEHQKRKGSGTSRSTSQKRPSGGGSGSRSHSPTRTSKYLSRANSCRQMSIRTQSHHGGQKSPALQRSLTPEPPQRTFQRAASCRIQTLKENNALPSCPRPAGRVGRSRSEGSKKSKQEQGLAKSSSTNDLDGSESDGSMEAAQANESTATSTSRPDGQGVLAAATMNGDVAASIAALVDMVQSLQAEVGALRQEVKELKAERDISGSAHSGSVGTSTSRDFSKFSKYSSKHKAALMDIKPLPGHRPIVPSPYSVKDNDSDAEDDSSNSESEFNS